MGVALEIAVQDPDGVAIAAAHQVDRVELCAALGATGGLTPSAGTMEAAAAVAGDVGVHVLIRPRPGGFVWSAAEVDVQVRDIRAAVRSGAAGVVVGALTADGLVDDVALAAFVAAAGDREVTFHRAIDTVADVFAAVDALAAAGVTRVLTSGGASRAIDGIDRLAAMTAHAAGRIQIMAGGGVGIGDIPALVGIGVDAVHLSAKRVVSSAGGPGGGGDQGYEVTDPELVAAAYLAVTRSGRPG